MDRSKILPASLVEVQAMRRLQHGRKFAVLLVLELDLDHREIAVFRILPGPLGNYLANRIIESWEDQFLTNLIGAFGLEQFATRNLFTLFFRFLCEPICNEPNRQLFVGERHFLFKELRKQKFNVCACYFECSRPIARRLSLLSQLKTPPTLPILPKPHHYRQALVAMQA